MTYCKTCRKEIAEGLMICPNCGTEVNKSGNGRLLYESGSGHRVLMILEIIIGLLACMMSIFFIVLSTSIDMQRQVLGGIHREPMLLIVIGVAMLCFGILVILFGINNIRCWTKIYDSHIEANTTTLTGLGNIRHVVIYNNQIESVSRVGKSVVVIYNGLKYYLLCEDPDRVYQLIIQKCSRH